MISLPGQAPPPPKVSLPSRKLLQDECGAHAFTYPGWGGLQAWPCARGVGGTENRPSVLYSSLIKRTHHRQPLLKYPKWGLLHRQQVCTKDAGFPGAVLRVDQMPQVRGGRERTQPDTAPLPSTPRHGFQPSPLFSSICFFLFPISHANSREKTKSFLGKGWHRYIPQSIVTKNRDLCLFFPELSH